MNLDEWRPVAALIDNLWKDDFDEGREAAYYRALSHLPADLVTRAIERIAGGRANVPGRRASDLAPSAETIAGEVRTLQFIGTWEWVDRMLATLIAAAREEVLVRQGENRHWYRPPDEFIPPDVRRHVEASDLTYGPMVFRFIEHMGGLAEVTRRRRAGAGGHWYRVGRRAWAELVQKLAIASTTA